MVMKWEKQKQTGTYTEYLEPMRMDWNSCWLSPAKPVTLVMNVLQEKLVPVATKLKHTWPTSGRFQREREREIWQDVELPRAWLLPHVNEVSCRQVMMCMGCDRQHLVCCPDLSVKGIWLLLYFQFCQVDTTQIYHHGEVWESTFLEASPFFQTLIPWEIGNFSAVSLRLKTYCFALSCCWHLGVQQ